MDFLGSVSFGDHFSQVWSSCAGAQKQGPAATSPGGKRAVGRGEGGMGGGEMNPFSHAVSLAFTCFTPFGPHKTLPKPALCVYYTDKATEVPAR